MNNTYVQQHWIELGLLLVWSILWKGWALWRAARQEDKAWFIVILILNTVGVLEMFYIFVFSKRHQSSVSSKQVKD